MIECSPSKSQSLRIVRRISKSTAAPHQTLNCKPVGGTGHNTNISTVLVIMTSRETLKKIEEIWLDGHRVGGFNFFSPAKVAPKLSHA